MEARELFLLKSSCLGLEAEQPATSSLLAAGRVDHHNHRHALRRCIELQRRDLTTATGPTQTIYTHAGSLYTQTAVKPPTAGTYFWRLCAANQSKLAVGLAGYFVPNPKTNVIFPSNLQNGTIAVMPPNGVICARPTGSPANRVGISTQVNARDASANPVVRPGPG